MRVRIVWLGVCLMLTSCMPTIQIDQSRLQELPAGAGWHYLQSLSPPGYPAFTKCVFEQDGSTITSIGLGRRGAYEGEVKWHVNRSDGLIYVLNGLVEFSNNNANSHWLAESDCTIALVPDESSEAGQKELVNIFSAARNAGIPLSCSNLSC